MKKKLIDHRKACGYSRRFVAEKLGYNYRTLTAKELGIRKFSVSDIRKLASFYGISLDEVED